MTKREIKMDGLIPKAKLIKLRYLEHRENTGYLIDENDKGNKPVGPRLCSRGKKLLAVRYEHSYKSVGYYWCCPLRVISSGGCSALAWLVAAFTPLETKNSLLTRRHKYKDIILSSSRGPCVEVMTGLIALLRVQV